MKVIRINVIEGRGKTGLAKTGAKRFLFADGTENQFNSAASKFYEFYKTKQPNSKLTFKDIRNQLRAIVLKYKPVEISDINLGNGTTLRIANLSLLNLQPGLDIDKTLAGQLVKA